MRRASGIASSVAVITSSCPGASPSPARTATSARRSRFFSNSGVEPNCPLENAVVEVMDIIIARTGVFTTCGRLGSHSGITNGNGVKHLFRHRNNSATFLAPQSSDKQRVFRRRLAWNGLRSGCADSVDGSPEVWNAEGNPRQNRRFLLRTLTAAWQRGLGTKAGRTGHGRQRCAPSRTTQPRKPSSKARS